MRTTKCVERILSVTEMLDSPNAPSVLDSLPKQPELRTDLAGQVHGQLAVVFIDLDNFKSVNDINGHQAGDTCLQKVAEVITECVTGKGKLYRYGGDEFVAILHNADRGWRVRFGGLVNSGSRHSSHANHKDWTRSKAEE